MRYIQGIYKKRDPILHRCQDGTFSTGACNWHGGISKEKLKKLSATGPDTNSLNWVRSVPLKDIFLSRELFQNRDSEFSKESVNKIITAVNNGLFHIQVFDPILLWRNPKDGRLYILSGHSRFEAFRRLSSEGNKQFDHIPARIIMVDELAAVNIARDSNNLATTEADSERAKRYRELLSSGLPLKEVMAKARMLEGSNAPRIVAYSFLNPGGKTFDFIKAMERGEVESAGNIKNIAYWIADARMRYKDLSNSHENELLDWLLKGAYTTLANREKFLERVKAAMARNTFLGQFDATKALNIANIATRSAYDQDMEMAMDELNQAKKERDLKLKELTIRKATPDQIERIMMPLHAYVTRAQGELTRIMQNKGAYQEAERSQAALFGVSGVWLAPLLRLGIMVAGSIWGLEKIGKLLKNK